MLHNLLFISPSKIVGSFCVAVGVTGFTLNSVNLHETALQTVSAVAIVGGGVILLWTRWQKARLEMAKQWYEFQAPSLNNRVEVLAKELSETKQLADTLTRKLETALIIQEELRAQIEESLAIREQLIDNNLVLSAQITSLSGRIEELTIRLSDIACPFSVAGKARCTTADVIPTTTVISN